MTKMCQGLSVTRSLLKMSGHWVKVGKNGGLSVKASEKKVRSFWWHVARNPKLSAPARVNLLHTCAYALRDYVKF